MDFLNQPEVQNCKMLCVWLLIGLGKLWNNFDKARWQAVRITSYIEVANFLLDDVPEVRAAAVYALGQLMRNKSVNNEHATSTNNYICDSLTNSCGWDGSVLVRLELVVAIQWFIIDYHNRFAETCLELDKRVFQDSQRISESSTNGGGSVANFSADRRTLSVGSQSSEGGSLTTSMNTSTFNTAVPSLTGRLYDRQNIYHQWQLLEKKALLSPFERIWVIALRLSFDPMSQVRDIAKKLVLYVTNEAEEIRKRIDEANSATLDSPKVKFVVGSPMTSEVLNALAKSNSLKQRIRNSSSGGDSSRTIDKFSAVSSSAIFTPKRRLNEFKVEDSQQPYIAVKDTDVLEPITTTEFVDWCGKIFNKRIYRTLYDEEQSGARDWMVDGVTRFTSLIPSDWALHTAEGVEHTAKRDVTRIQKCDPNTFPSSLTINFDRTIHCLEWSYLRPFVYVCDGRKVQVFNTRVNSRTVTPKFEFVVNDDPLFEDPLSDIIVVNEKNHEMLLMGTQDGLISVWDPYFDEHSHDNSGTAKMLTSNHIFNDQTRIYNNYQNNINNKRFTKYSHNKINHTLYRWDQNNGRLLCGGNVRIARIWDAWAEKNKTDINLDMKDGISSSLCADFNQELVCIGFNSGVSSIYDIRIAGKFSKIMGIRSETRSKVVGCSFLGESSTLVIGHEDGIIKVYDPRQFEEPLEVFKADEYRVSSSVKSSPYSNPLTASFMSFGSLNNNVVKRPNYPLTMNNMIVQSSNSIIACAMNDSTIRLFDLEGKRHKSLEYVLHPQTTQPILPSTVSTMRFHSRRVHLAVATEKNVVGIYVVN
uniref:Uncharacterized protein n=1 Tax=Panagrolaimus superbus TaxID=310955 RepID=A0A914YRN4_9BILA